MSRLANDGHRQGFAGCSRHVDIIEQAELSAPRQDLGNAALETKLASLTLQTLLTGT